VALAALPDSFAPTRLALHAVAEHVCAAARYASERRIGLVPTPGGFGTPLFGDDEQVRVDGIEIVHRRRGAERRAPLTTLEAAAEFVGVPLGAPDVYTAVTPAVPDALLAGDAASAAVLADWYAFAADALSWIRAEYAAHAPSDATLWPEHFDYALDLGDADGGTRANYGASPGDDAIAVPYLYVGPWAAAARTGFLAEHSFGAACPYDELRGADDPGAAARAFFTRGAQQLLGRAQRR
jgi:hypothetical protein